MSWDYLALWALTVANSFAILLLIRQVAQHPAYRQPQGPKPGTPFENWSLSTLAGQPRTAAEMPEEYTMLFASDSCGPCRTLFDELARSGRTRGALVVAADGESAALVRAAATASEPLYDDFLSGADHPFRQQHQIPGTPFAVAVRHGRVVASGPAGTPAQLQQVADALAPAAMRTASH